MCWMGRDSFSGEGIATIPENTLSSNSSDIVCIDAGVAEPSCEMDDKAVTGRSDPIHVRELALMHRTNICHTKACAR